MEPDEYFNDLCSMAARELPEGFSVTVCLERGYGGIDLYGADGERIDCQCYDDDSLSERLKTAIQWAKRTTTSAD